MAITPTTFSSVVNTATNFLSNPTVQQVASTAAQGANSTSSFGASASGGSSSSDTKKQTEEMIWANIWANMKRMQEESMKKLEEAMKKTKP